MWCSRKCVQNKIQPRDPLLTHAEKKTTTHAPRGLPEAERILLSHFKNVSTTKRQQPALGKDVSLLPWSPLHTLRRAPVPPGCLVTWNRWTLQAGCCVFKEDQRRIWFLPLPNHPLTPIHSHFLSQTSPSFKTGKGNFLPAPCHVHKPLSAIPRTSSSQRLFQLGSEGFRKRW